MVLDNHSRSPQATTGRAVARRIIWSRTGSFATDLERNMETWDQDPQTTEDDAREWIAGSFLTAPISRNVDPNQIEDAALTEEAALIEGAIRIGETRSLCKNIAPPKKDQDKDTCFF
jgi:hypothetical protein